MTMTSDDEDGNEDRDEDEDEDGDEDEDEDEEGRRGQMSQDTPERLKEFRAQYAPKRQPAGALAVVQLAVMVVGFGAVLAVLVRGAGPAPGQSGGLTPENQRGFAVALAEKNEPRAALEAYEAYLNVAALTQPERAKVCYAVAKLAMEAEEFERALAYLYQAEFLDPGSELKEEVDKKVVLCLDKLGRAVDLRKELRRRTDVKRTLEDLGPDEQVLAEFAGEVVTGRDLEEKIETLPPALRDSVTTPEQKLEMLKHLVAERLLLDKARRLELDKDPEIEAQMVQQLDAMIVNKLIRDEVAASVNVTPEDVERFFKAEIERFTEPASAKVLVAQAATEEAAKALTEFPDEPVTMRAGRPVPGTPAGLDASEAVSGADVGGVAGPVEAEGAWYVFKVVSKTPEKVPAFEEVKDQATRLYQMQKEQESLAALIEETLEARDVRLHPEALQEPEAPL